MTNETTVIQPCPTCGGSKVDPGGLPVCRTCSKIQQNIIGDDAQFQALLCSVWRDKTGEAVPALVAYIHEYFRAPAAQASATIRAALRTSFADYWWEARHERRTQEDHAKAAWDFALKSAATIQEPVMVEEPVEEGWPTNAMISAGFKAGLSGKIGSGFRAMQAAAPMVADPTGVESMRAAFEAQANIVNKGRMPNGTYNSIGTEALWQNFSVAYRAGLAATVKAVPNNYHDAYRGARDDLADWKRRALGAEHKLAHALSEINGPTFMGEPVKAVPSDALSGAALDVLAERRRQVEVEGWSAARDDRYIDCQLAAAAATYALCTQPNQLKVCGVTTWPWSAAWWKPTTYRNNLVKSGALILAEIERIDRAAPLADKTGGGE